MTRLIDADKIKYTSIAHLASYPVAPSPCDTVMRAEINAMPTVDAVPVRHGKWVQRFIKIGGQVFKHGMQCSVCAEPALDNEGDDYLTNYCPNCGAKMDGERKEE